MTRFFDLDEANGLLPEVRTILEGLRDERAELIRLRDKVVATQASEETPSETPTEANVGGASRPSEPAERDGNPNDAEVRVLRLRMQGVIDQMQAAVARIDELGITLREIETGLIDFPALASGRQIWLCWRLGEDDVEWWHELGDGFSNRRALADLT
ncbi:MAG TPA: DUF2203 domain-containing protein [Candidatus Limnocylindrales bacterium]|nr:DUF2203 domain-containing protein [Candidatus Limnocylindrales bacterium]